MPPVSSSSSSEHEVGHQHTWAGHYDTWSRSPSAEDCAGEASPTGAVGATSDTSQPTLRRRLSNVPKLGGHSAQAQARWAKVRRDAMRSSQQKPSRRAAASQERHALSCACERIVKTRVFDRMVAAVVLLNGLCMAVDVDVSQTARPRLKGLLSFLEHAFVIFFCAEAALKALAFGWRAMLASRNYRFELLLAVVGAADLWFIDFRVFGVHFNEADFGLNVLPLLRAVRFVKVFKHGELALISRCLFPAFGTLWHVGLFLFIIIFMFSIPLARLVGQNPIWEDTPEIVSLFGTVPRTFYALLQMVINPDTDTMRVLFERQPWTAPFFIVFVGMTTFTIMSIMFGSVTDCYKELRDSQKRRDGHAERMRREGIRRDLLRELREADRQEVGLVSALSGKEFKRQLQSPQFRGALQSLEVDQDTVDELLRLLEIDGGAIRYEEFVSALGLVGEAAKATHVLWLRAMLAEDIKHLGSRVERVEGQLATLGTRMEGMEERVTQKLDEVLQAVRKS